VIGAIALVGVAIAVLFVGGRSGHAKAETDAEGPGAGSETAAAPRS